MRVAEVMTRGVDPIDPAATVQEAATVMAELDVGSVLVGTPEGLDGILTDRDIILRLVVDGRSSAHVPVREIMSTRIFSCREDDAIETVFTQMRERQIRRMPVVDEGGRPVGIVALSDIARFVESPERITETLREISEPHRSRKAAESEPANGAPASDGEALEAVAARA